MPTTIIGIETTDASMFASAEDRKRLLRAQLMREPIKVIGAATDGYSDIEFADGSKMDAIADVHIRYDSPQTIHDLCVVFNVVAVHRAGYAGFALRLPCDGGEFLITDPAGDTPSMHATCAMIEFRNSGDQLQSRELLPIKSIMRLIVERLTR